MKRKWQVALATGLGLMALMYVPLYIDTMDWLMPAIFVVATVVQFWAGSSIYASAWAAAKHHSTNMTTLVALGTGVAYGYSTFVTLWPGLAEAWGLPIHVYYETSLIIIALVLAGKWMEARAKKRTAAAVTALVGLAPKTALVVRDGVESDIPVEQVVVGDIVRIRPGEKIPVDGVVTSGTHHRRREHADRREPAGGQGRRGHRHRRHPQHHRVGADPGQRRRGRHRPGPDHPPRRGRPGLQGAHAAPRRQGLLDLRAGRHRHRRPDRARLGASSARAPRTSRWRSPPPSPC